jgi:RimJ/RimL family protein N-acetyltransferase
MSVPTLETERLVLSPWGHDQLDATVEMDLDPAVRGVADVPERAARYAELKQRIDDGWPAIGGMWAVEWRDHPGFLGWCGLFPLDNSTFIEIGYRYRRLVWGRGVASEAARVVLDHGFRVLELDPIVAVTHPTNAASRNVLTKIGLRHEGTGFHYDSELPFFRLGRAEYLAATSS